MSGHRKCGLNYQGCRETNGIFERLFMDPKSSQNVSRMSPVGLPTACWDVLAALRHKLPSRNPLRLNAF